jgi:hypothetical protein
MEEKSGKNGHAGGGNGTVNRNGQAGAPPLAPPSDNGRDHGGRFTAGNNQGHRFTAGNKAGLGNPFFRKQAEVRKAILDDLGTDAVKKLMRQMYSQAMAGDVNAAKVVLLWTVGKPAKAVDPDGCDADELARLDASPGLSRLWARMLEGLDVRQALELFKDALNAKAGLGVRELQPGDLEQVKAELAAKVGK